MNTNKTPAEIHAAASAAVRDGEARNLSERTMAKKYRALFAAEDALKASAGWMR